MSVADRRGGAGCPLLAALPVAVAVAALAPALDDKQLDPPAVMCGVLAAGLMIAAAALVAAAWGPRAVVARGAAASPPTAAGVPIAGSAS